jgi:hypothetical protein
MLYQTKSHLQTLDHVKKIIQLIHTHYHITPKYVRTDNGPEFLIPELYVSKGIIHQKSRVETPQ